MMNLIVSREDELGFFSDVISVIDNLIMDTKREVTFVYLFIRLKPVILHTENKFPLVLLA